MRSASQVRICPLHHILTCYFLKISQRLDQVPPESISMPSRGEAHSLDLNKDGRVDVADVTHIFSEAERKV